MTVQRALAILAAGAVFATPGLPAAHAESGNADRVGDAGHQQRADVPDPPPPPPPSPSSIVIVIEKEGK